MTLFLFAVCAFAVVFGVSVWVWLRHGVTADVFLIVERCEVCGRGLRVEDVREVSLVETDPTGQGGWILTAFYCEEHAP